MFVRRINKIILVSVCYPAYLLLIFTLILPATDLTAQELSSKASRQSSLEAFSKGNYEQAYLEFSELLDKYPKDPMYKYYSGVCLVKLHREPEKAEKLLGEAQQGSAVARAIPPDLLFWLGRAQQMSGKFVAAINSYNSFTDLNGRKKSRELGIPDFIQQCDRGEGKLTEEDTAVTRDNQPAVKEEENIISHEEGDSDIVAVKTDTLSGDYDKILAEALEYQHKADSLYRVTEEQKKGLDTLSYAERTRIRSEIAEVEKTAASYQDHADEKYDEAQAAMNSTPFTTGLITGHISPPETDSSGLKETDSIIIKDSITVTVKTERDEEALAQELVEDMDTTGLAEKEIGRPAGEVAVYSHFEITQGDSDEEIPVDPEMPDGLLYRIQVAVFRNPVARSYFKGMTPVYGFKMPGRDLTIYYAGMFRRLSDADNALAAIRKIGFNDAFVSAYFDGKAISMERAEILENEWGKISFEGVKAAEQVPADTVPPTLTFRVEIARTAEPVDDENLDDFRRVSGTRGLEAITLPGDTVVYLIGTFITWESAEEYADLLVRNGYSEAKVGAWLGKHEIPVETARELFEMLE